MGGKRYSTDQINEKLRQAEIERGRVIASEYYRRSFPDGPRSEIRHSWLALQPLQQAVVGAVRSDPEPDQVVTVLHG